MSRRPPADPAGDEDRLLLDRERLRLPLLTEEIAARAIGSVPVTAGSLPPPFFQPELLAASVAEARAAHGDAGAVAEATLVERVLADLQRQLDANYEQRLREALVPVLTRLGEQLLDQARLEIAASLRELVTQAVQQELQRQRRR